MTQKNHIHKFRRKTYKTGSSVFYCIDNCPYKTAVAFSLGKETRCNVCDKPFRINEYSIRAAKPKCNDCINRRSLKGVSSANPMVGTIQTTAEDRVSALQSKLEQATASTTSKIIIKEYNPDDDETLL